MEKQTLRTCGLFSTEADWRPFRETENIQKKDDCFLDIYREAIETFVPKFKIKEKWRKDWFNKRCESMKNKRDDAWRKYRKRMDTLSRNEYQRGRNNYVNIRREEERNFEKSIIDKCKEEPKLFYRIINEKLKQRKEIDKTKVSDTVYEDPKMQVEIMNKYFQGFFTKEKESNNIEGVKRQTTLSNTITNEQEILRMLESLDVRKAVGPYCWRNIYNYY